MRIAALYRHPVKGLSPEPLDEAQLEPGGYFPDDRSLRWRTALRVSTRQQRNTCPRCAS